MVEFKFDGYAVGDSALEGILFLVKVDEINTKVLSVTPLNASDAEYLKNLNLPKYLKKIEEFLNEEMEDMFDSDIKKESWYMEEFLDFAQDIGLFPL